MERPPEMADEQPEMANNEEVGVSTANRMEGPQQETIAHPESLPTENGIHSPAATTLASNLSDNELNESAHRRRRSQTHKERDADDDRPMGHYPPRDSHPESRQESPPTAFVDTYAQSQLHDSWHQLQEHLEEHVSKPSKEALHKFFYPPGNSPRKRSNKAYHMSERDREKLKARANIENQTKSEGLDSQEGTGRPNDAPLVDSGQGPSAGEPTVQVQQPQPTSSTSQQSATTHSHPPDSILRTASSGRRSLGDSVGQPFSLPTSPSLPVSRDFQHSFDQEEEQDRKYVEGFWRVYDDLIMLSLFTQLGVVARLAASTWFTFFDGVFRHDSPLFTNLPLNCLSCFLLGFMGSGDRLMEMVTTRFTPRHLQQSIVQGGGHAEEEEPSDDDLYYDGEGPDDKDRRGRGGGGLRQRRNRRPKRAKTNEHFHSWQPPLHWHDDLREVQLLALERRIRASKCLVLFPVMKEDADVMEHYFGEGYKASAEKEQRAQQIQCRNSVTRRRRRRFGRQKYCATNLADSDDSHFLEQSGHESSSFSEFDIDDQEFGGIALENSKVGDESDDGQGGYVDDGRFRFDLELTESTRKPTSKAASPGAVDTDSAGKADGDANNNSASAAALPPSVQKLIKRAPGKTTNDGPSPVATLSASSTQQYGSAGESHSIDPHQMEGPQPINNSTSGPQTAFTTNQAQAEPAIETGVQMVSLGSGTPTYAGTPQPQPSNTTNQSYPLDQPLQEADGGQEVDPQLEHIISNVQARVSENISRIGRVNLADGWDVGTTPEAMADDLMLGLRDGFCGALSSFSSWNSSMLNLLKEGHIGEAVVGYMLGIQLPIVAYRFGQQSAVYFFVWRCRRETKRAERMGGYGIRVRMDDDDDDDDNNVERNPSGSVGDSFEDELSRGRSAETPLDDESLSPEIPSVRAICTALYLLSLVTQCTSLSFFSDPEDQQIALSLLFSPFGTLTRWRLSRFNSWHPGFPLGTFTCNIVACALGGSLGSLLAGNPGPKERILLQSLIAGFGGTLSSLATFIVEILAGMDPLLFRFDGLIYCGNSLFWALIVGFVFSASVDWADETT